MKKRLLTIFLALCLTVGLLPATALADGAKLAVNVVFPTGEKSQLHLDPSTKIYKVREDIEVQFQISFDDGYWLYCNDVTYTKSGDYTLTNPSKTTLQDYGFQSGYTIHVHKNSYTATEEDPIHVFGLTIYGGTGAPEPYGDYSSADFYWNYYYKTIYIQTQKPITISGTGEDGANIFIKSGGSWKYVTFDNVTLNNTNKNCVWVNPGGSFCLDLKGENHLTSGATNAAVMLSNNFDPEDPKTNFWIRGEGTLDITSTRSDVPAIGQEWEDTTQTAEFTLQNGTVTAQGGTDAPGIWVDQITIKGGTLTGISGAENCPGIIGNGGITIEDGMYVKTPAGGAVQKQAYQTQNGPSDMIAVDASTPAQTVVVTALPQSFRITYVLNGGRFTAGQEIGSYAPGQVTTLPTPERENYVFAGWYEDEAFAGVPVTEIGVEARGDKTFYAKWAPASDMYTLTFETDGGSAVKPVTAAAGTEILLDQVSEKGGYLFTGWYTDNTRTTNVTSIKLTGNTTVYAGWKKMGDGEALYQKKKNGEWLLDTFVKACAEVYDGGTVKLVKNVDVKKTIVFTGRDVTITSYDPQNPCTIYRAARDFEINNYNAHLLVANYDGDYRDDTFDQCVMRLEHITVDGRSKENVVAADALLANNASVIYLGEGVSLQNNSNTSETNGGGYGGGISNFCGDIILEAGSQIVNCEASTGGAIHTQDGTITIDGGKIEGNRATADLKNTRSSNLCGGGIFCTTIGNATTHHKGYALVNLISGSISNNTAGYRGGGLYYTDNCDILGTFNMTGGIVQGNAAPSGGGIYVVEGKMKLTGGKITGNTATTDGGGIYCAPWDHAIYLSGSPNVTGNFVGSAANNIVMFSDGDSDAKFYTKSIILEAALNADAAIGVTRVQKPTKSDPVKLVAEPLANAYTITANDLAKFTSDDPDYALEILNGNIVMKIASRVSGLTIVPEKLTMYTGDTAKITATVMPADASNKTVIWSSNDESIATVNANGIVTAKAVGETTIVATTVDGNHTATCRVTVQTRGGGGGGTSYYTLHYASNGGTAYKDERYTSNTVVQLNKVPFREGYVFTGWYADKKLTNNITEIRMTSDKTVYAGWELTSIPSWLNGDEHFAYVIGYSDGTVRPNINISRAEVATVFFRLLKADVRDGNVTSVNGFDDVKKEMWYNTPISTVAALGIVKGRSAATFDPDASITRAEFAAICARFDMDRTNGDSDFSDISGHWAEAEIKRAVSLGWIQGYGDGTFRPDQPITRAEAMAIINRVLNRLPESEDDLLPDMRIWTDNRNKSAWYYLDVQEATNSHDFSQRTNKAEHWTKLTPPRDWTIYEVTSSAESSEK